MKRIICATVMTCLILTVLSSCQCKHIWEDATCENPSYCSECGETQGAALGHSFEPATCTAPSRCRNCSKTQGTALGHSVGIGRCSKCNHYSYTLRAEATEIDEIMTECIEELTTFGEHLVEYSMYSSDAYKRLAVAEAFATLSVGLTNALVELEEESKEHAEFSQIREYSVDALTIILDVLKYYEGGFTNHELWEKMYDAFNKLVPIVEDINDEISNWHL